MYRLLRLVGVVGVSLLVAACGVAFPDDNGGCAAKVSLNVRLHVDQGDPRHIWATDLGTGAEMGLRIPGGYGAGATEIFAPDGRAFGRDGDIVVSGCWDYVQNAAMIREEDVVAEPGDADG